MTGSGFRPGRIYKADIAAAGYCASGAREWLRLNDFTSQDLLEGIPQDRILATGCGLGAEVVRLARLREKIEAERG